ncbi:catalase family peroxidase [Occallatibacter riparius]|uniref:Catalase-related peroxidase n=1 Tax=Occallatibacter riparius TaxID=1002689 RepID=A0A9J7BUR1_9BACT|nr:catalase family peroxidase [Occallatibacter riparius]UWZ84741.1 catalase family peroxidase [Occallatibacter riparius]
MPLPNDERLVALANDILLQFDQLFGVHPGYRPAHAKGLMLIGTFTPATQARSLTMAPHILSASTAVTARFSNSTGLPEIPDSAPESNPRGLAIRFNLAEHVHTDIVSHSTNGFPARNGEEFLGLLRAIAASGSEVPSPKPIEQFLGSHPAALAFVQAPKPFPSSLASDTYFAPSAYSFTNDGGETRFGRYRIVPEEGNDYLSDSEVIGLAANYHYDELAERVTIQPIRFHIRVQLAKPGDITDDVTVHWPEDRELVDFGTIELTEVVPDSVVQQKHIIFDPIPRVEGIANSADPLLELRAAIYLVSGRRRRAARVQEQESELTAGAV